PFKISVSAIQKADDALMLEFHYNASLFSVSDIQRLADQYYTLLQSALEQPEALLCELAILSEKARAELLVVFNATGGSAADATYPAENYFQRLFEEQVELTPETIAVVFEDVECEFNPHLTYQQLNAQANQLAHLLRRTGVGSDVPVGICM